MSTCPSSTPTGKPDEGIFTVRGIFSTGVVSYDDSSVFMPLAQAQAFAGTGDRASAIVMLLERRETMPAPWPSTLEAPGVSAVTSTR